MDTTEPRALTPQQAAVAVVCDAFGWNPALKGGHAAAFAKDLRTKLGLTLEQFTIELNAHYGAADPGPGEWWVYREVWPCKAGKGDFPTPAIVRNTWGRWERPIAVQMPRRFAGVQAFLESAND